ncbi:MAG: hypothetical protein ACRDMX_02185 [Solirubrobacteraceae bacterium]
MVVSDLHLGTRLGADVLAQASVRARLTDAVEGADRLVLLGDLLELRHGPLRDALVAAREPLSEIGAALGPDGEVVVLAGNHDHRLIDDFARRRELAPAPVALAPETAVDWREGEALEEVARLLAPARVRAAYPGVWLRDDVYATHGHYLDLHLTVPTLERLATGVMRRVVALDGTGPTSIEDYETVLAPLYAWIDALAQRVAPERGALMHGGSVRGWQALAGGRDLRRRGRLRARVIAAAWPVAIAGCNRLGLGPLRPALSTSELRRAGLEAIGEVVARTGVDATWVIFGHTHRAGPLAADDPGPWRAPSGTRLLNCGCWVREAALQGRNPSSSPYRPGFCVVLQDDGPPALVDLLDG